MLGLFTDINKVFWVAFLKIYDRLMSSQRSRRDVQRPHDWGILPFILKMFLSVYINRKMILQHIR